MGKKKLRTKIKEIILICYPTIKLNYRICIKLYSFLQKQKYGTADYVKYERGTALNVFDVSYKNLPFVYSVLSQCSLCDVATHLYNKMIVGSSKKKMQKACEGNFKNINY